MARPPPPPPHKGIPKFDNSPYGSMTEVFYMGLKLLDKICATLRTWIQLESLLGSVFFVCKVILFVTDIFASDIVDMVLLLLLN